MTNPSGSQVARQSTRVALWATGLVALLYTAVAVTIVAWLTVSLTAQIDERLDRTLVFELTARRMADQQPADVPPVAPPPADDGAVPRGPLPFGRDRAFWFIDADGSVTSLREDLPLPADHYGVTTPTTIDIDGTQLRVAGRSLPDGHLVVGEALAPLDDARTSVILGLLAIAPILLLSVFLGSLAVGRRVAMPIERARQRQLAFTADASHELRTPLSVIEANASLALAAERDVAWYRHAFERVQGESGRMRRLIEELLWLARFDALQRPPQHEPVDLGVLVEQAADRFAAPAEARSLSLQVRHDASGVTLSAPPEWLDQLIGVLLDNACKYSPVGGIVVVGVSTADRRVVLTVDDSGPGIPEDRRDQVFDRFRRDTEQPGGAGLGLAIADAIVRATSGRWHIGTSPQGGARMAVSWPTAGGAQGGS